MQISRRKRSVNTFMSVKERLVVILIRYTIHEKKSKTYSDRDENKRAAYLTEIQKLNPKRIVYVDESGMNDNDFYPYAYAPIGERYYEARTGYYKKRISMIGGLCYHQFFAPMMLEGHCNTTVFETYIEQILVPQLKPGMTIIIDNASFHKSDKIKQLINKAGCQLRFLPPYSPDLNPIEHYWYKIKNDIRKIMRNQKISIEQAMISTLVDVATC